MPALRAVFVRVAGAIALLVTVSASPRIARADDDATEVCSAAHLAAQKDRRDHRLTAARDDLLVCARDACPALIRRDCVEWLVGVQAALPTVVVDARARDGSALASARAYVDGRTFAAALDGKALEVDPGDHRLRVEAPGRAPAEKAIIVREGEHAQHIVVVLDDVPAASTASPSARRAGPPIVSIGLAAAGVIGVGLFTGFGLAGRSIKSDLDASGCRPSCDSSRVSSMWRDFTIADVSLVVGIAAFGSAAVVYGLDSSRTTRAAQALGRGFTW